MLADILQDLKKSSKAMVSATLIQTALQSRMPAGAGGLVTVTLEDPAESHPNGAVRLEMQFDGLAVAVFLALVHSTRGLTYDNVEVMYDNKISVEPAVGARVQAAFESRLTRRAISAGLQVAILQSTGNGVRLIDACIDGSELAVWSVRDDGDERQVR